MTEAKTARLGWPWTDDFAPPAQGSTGPKITLITPSFNQGAFLEATVRSVLQQGYPELEYIVMDGGSTDGSVDILRRYDEHLSRWVSEPDQGQAHAINKGLEGAKGEVVGWLNSDDILLPGALHRVADAWTRERAAVAWVGSCYRMTADHEILSEVKPRGLTGCELVDWPYGGFFYQPACFFSLSAYREVGGLDESLDLAFDLDFWLKLRSVGPFATIADPLASAVIHDQAKTRARRAQMWSEVAVVQCRHGEESLAVSRLVERFNAREAGWLHPLVTTLKMLKNRLCDFVRPRRRPTLAGVLSRRSRT